ncbi:PREDICTED: uncharacterized protein LOC106724482 isoform X3 [Myotis brandtii]|uniref:uncharacterized protein LOC106724482 isoform X3 n=1 Tax=Myotis brandtii TaxID=109478 RepID=UPI0007043F2C|nr:PREDICTED: uncharacterized protein LOC106724482 isoform X3 [Myotis brandtii]
MAGAVCRSSLRVFCCQSRPDSDLPTCLKPQQLNPRARNLTFPSWARSSLGSGQDLLPLPPAETSQKTPPAVDWKMNSPKSRVLYFSPPPTCIQFSGTNAPPQAHHAGGEGRPACQSQGDPGDVPAPLCPCLTSSPTPCELANRLSGQDGTSGSQEGDFSVYFSGNCAGWAGNTILLRLPRDPNWAGSLQALSRTPSPATLANTRAPSEGGSRG